MNKANSFIRCFDNQPQPLSAMKEFFLIIFAVVLSVATAQGQTLLSETTWGGNGSDVSDGVAVAVRRRLVRRRHHRQLHHG